MIKNGNIGSWSLNQSNNLCSFMNRLFTGCKFVCLFVFSNLFWGVWKVKKRCIIQFYNQLGSLQVYIDILCIMWSQ